MSHLPRTGGAGEAMAFSTQKKLQELPPTPTFESFHGHVQNQEEENDFLDSILRKDNLSDHDAGDAQPLPAQTLHGHVQEQEQDFLDNVLRKDNPSDHDAGDAQPLPAQTLPLPTDLISKKPKRNLSFIFYDLYSLNNNTSSDFQSVSPMDVDVDVDDFTALH